MSAPSGYKQSVVVPLPSDGEIRAVIGEDYDPDTASNAGLTDTEIDATTSDGPVSGVAPGYVLICAATDELLGTGTLTDDTLSRLLDAFGPEVTRKYIVTISWFSMLSLFLNATRTPLETTDKIGTRTSPLG
jgi:hypothetical protein